jgi:MFS family permease
MRARLRRTVLGAPAMVPLSTAHGLAAAADTFVTVSLAQSLFFSLSPSASRREVLLYLVITMAPLAVLSPLVGPTVDRLRSRPSWLAAGTYVLRAGFCVALSTSLYQLSFYPYAVGLLVCSKASGVIKQALVPLVTPNADDLVSANALLARISMLGGVTGGAAAVGVLNVASASAVLMVAAVLFVAAAVAAFRLRAPARPEQRSDTVEDVEMRFPMVGMAAVGFVAIRAAVGFFVFTMAFTLRSASEPPWVYGVAIGAYGGGATLGNVVTPLLRRWLSELTLLVAAVGGPALLAAVGVLGVSRPLLIAIAAFVGLSTTVGRHAFDSLLQNQAPESLRGRAGARFETRFSLAYVGGAVLATPLVVPIEASMAVLIAIYVPALSLFVRAFARTRGVDRHPEVATAAIERLAAAEAHVRRGAHAAAIVDASSAADLALLDSGVSVDRRELDDLRAAALAGAGSPIATVDEGDARRAIGLVAQWISRRPEPSPPSPSPRRRWPRR